MINCRIHSYVYNCIEPTEYIESKIISYKYTYLQYIFFHISNSIDNTGKSHQLLIDTHEKLNHGFSDRSLEIFWKRIIVSQKLREKPGSEKFTNFLTFFLPISQRCPFFTSFFFTFCSHIFLSFLTDF